MYTLKYKYHFDSAHQLPDAYTQKCHNLHGHTWKVLIKIKSPGLENNMVVDFTRLKEILNQLDHCNLNDIIKIPTAENISLHIYNKILEIPHTYTWHVDVTVWENDNASITIQ